MLLLLFLVACATPQGSGVPRNPVLSAGVGTYHADGSEDLGTALFFALNLDQPVNETLTVSLEGPDGWGAAGSFEREAGPYPSGGYSWGWTLIGSEPISPGRYDVSVEVNGSAHRVSSVMDTSDTIAPASVIAALQVDDGVSISWEPVAGARSYLVRPYYWNGEEWIRVGRDSYTRSTALQLSGLGLDPLGEDFLAAYVYAFSTDFTASRPTAQDSIFRASRVWHRFP